MNCSLPKWPALLVVGDRVTTDQAAEIIVRTAGYAFCTNDRAWHRQIKSVPIINDLKFTALSPGGERGCTIEQLKYGLKLAEQK